MLSLSGVKYGIIPRMAKKKQQWQKKDLRLKDDHTWKAPEGYKLVVLDRGAVSFNIPQEWFVARHEPFEMHDGEPPDDNARLSVSFWRLQVGVDWSGLPQVEMLASATRPDRNDLLEQGDIQTIPRDDLEVVWVQQRFLDPQEKREAYTRITVARGQGVQVLITFDYWVDDAEKFVPVWQEVIRSLQLGRVIADPTQGETLH